MIDLLAVANKLACDRPSKVTSIGSASLLKSNLWLAKPSSQELVAASLAISETPLS
jgi:hypothetical protein